MATDPVCGMQVEEKQAAASAQYEGKTYYFCSHDCHKSFLANPGRYTRIASAEPARGPTR